jgi:hypothetical protein
MDFSEVQFAHPEPSGPTCFRALGRRRPRLLRDVFRGRGHHRNSATDLQWLLFASPVRLPARRFAPGLNCYNVLGRWEKDLY